MDDHQEESSLNWFNMKNPFKRNELNPGQKGISEVSPTLFKPTSTNPQLRHSR